MRKVGKKNLGLKRETLRVVSGEDMKGIRGGYITEGISTSYHGGACPSGQTSCDTYCGSSLSG